jgi:hypothetical protein
MGSGDGANIGAGMGMLGVTLPPDTTISLSSGAAGCCGVAASSGCGIGIGCGDGVNIGARLILGCALPPDTTISSPPRVSALASPATFEPLPPLMGMLGFEPGVSVQPLSAVYVELLGFVPVPGSSIPNSSATLGMRYDAAPEAKPPSSEFFRF